VFKYADVFGAIPLCGVVTHFAVSVISIVANYLKVGLERGARLDARKQRIYVTKVPLGP
jgi:hypothetical protein